MCVCVCSVNTSAERFRENITKGVGGNFFILGARDSNDVYIFVLLNGFAIKYAVRHTGCLEIGFFQNGFVEYSTAKFIMFFFDPQVTMGQLRADQVFDFKGSTDPCAVMHVIRGFQNPSKLNEELIERFVAAISEHIESKLGIPKSRYESTWT